MRGGFSGDEECDLAKTVCGAELCFPRHSSFALLFGHAHPAQHAMRKKEAKPVIGISRQGRPAAVRFV